MRRQTYYTPGDKSIYGNIIDELESERGRLEAGFQTVFSSVEQLIPSENLNFYIDPTNGNDATADGAIITPFKTWKAFWESNVLPKATRKSINVKIFPGVLDWVYLSGINVYQPGSLNIYADMKPAVITGMNQGTASGGTTYSLQKAGAGWAPNQLAGKSWRITAGTHMWYSGKIVTNTATEFFIAPLMGTPIDATDVFIIEESTVLVNPPLMYNHPNPLTVYDSRGNINIQNLDFQANEHRYQYYAGRITRSGDGIIFFNCMFRGSSPASLAALKDPLWTSRAHDSTFFLCSFISQEGVTTESIIQHDGPTSKMDYYGCAFNDCIHVYYGMDHLSIQNCHRIQRAGSTGSDVLRTVNYFQPINSRIDFNLTGAGIRFDGPSCMDARYTQFLRSSGKGLWTYGYYGDGVRLSFIGGEVGGCVGDGIDVGPCSSVAMVSLLTNPAAINGGWGLKLRNGAKAAYAGVSSLKGALGDVNLGDGVTNVPINTTATDTTHLTRIAPFGG